MTEKPPYDFDVFVKTLLSGPEMLNGFLEGIAGIINNSRDAVLFVNPQQQVMFFTKGAERMFGYTASEVFGQPMWILAVPEEIPSNAVGFAQFIQSEARSYGPLSP
ncbi:MAG: PAS domain S-box protein [Anaerolineales bacterium]|nr:PAS domain S-box protein [Anaerolineales bacterium]